MRDFESEYPFSWFQLPSNKVYLQSLHRLRKRLVGLTNQAMSFKLFPQS
jgi:hypothetical protein